ncbi:hypothetical protein J6590_067494 [Homalodisca vitripennis]|nr:hypothetical protein J6590_067494 [Homalodisca vitripennis]
MLSLALDYLFLVDHLKYDVVTDLNPGIFSHIRLKKPKRCEMYQWRSCSGYNGYCKITGSSNRSCPCNSPPVWPLVVVRKSPLREDYLWKNSFGVGVEEVKEHRLNGAAVIESTEFRRREVWAKGQSVSP